MKSFLILIAMLTAFTAFADATHPRCNQVVRQDEDKVYCSNIGNSGTPLDEAGAFIAQITPNGLVKIQTIFGPETHDVFRGFISIKDMVFSTPYGNMGSCYLDRRQPNGLFTHEKVDCNGAPLDFNGGLISDNCVRGKSARNHIAGVLCLSDSGEVTFTREN